MLLKSKTKTNRPASYCIRMKNKQTISFVVSFNILRHLRKKSVMIVGHSFGFAGLFDNKLVYTGIRIGCQRNTVLSEPNRIQSISIFIRVNLHILMVYIYYFFFFSMRLFFHATKINLTKKQFQAHCNSV